MVDLLDYAVLVGGLRVLGLGRGPGHAGPGALRREPPAPRIRAPIAASLTAGAPFQEPPAGDDRDPSRFVGAKVPEFPPWFVCQNPRCRVLYKAADALDCC